MNVGHAVHAGLLIISGGDTAQGPQRVCSWRCTCWACPYLSILWQDDDESKTETLRLRPFVGIPWNSVQDCGNPERLGKPRIDSDGGTGTTLSWPWMRLLTRLEWFCSLPGTEFYKDGLTLITRWRSPWEIESRRQRERWVDVNRAVVWTVYWYTVSYYYIILYNIIYNIIYIIIILIHCIILLYNIVYIYNYYIILHIYNYYIILY